MVVTALLVIAGGLWRHSRPGPATLSFGTEPDRIPLIELEVDPAHLASLDAGVPRGVPCARPRGAAVPVRRVAVDGRALAGRFEVRYRGLCREHWSGPDKSLELTGLDGARILGRAELNLNVAASDAELFDAWVGRMASVLGVPATRTAFARVSVNGAEPTARVVVENLDRDLLESHGLPRGPIYRERFLATLGEGYSADALASVYRSSGDRRAGFHPLQRLDRAVRDADRAVQLADVVDLDAYADYLALTIISGTGHVSDHNLPLYAPRGTARFAPIANDFSNDSLGEHRRRADALESVWQSHNRLSQIVMADDAARRRVHRRVAGILARRDLAADYDEYIDAIERAVPALAGVDRAGVRARLAFVRRQYLEPIARVSPALGDGGRFQLAIEGAGAYRVRLRVAGSCAPGDVPAYVVRVHAGPPIDAVDCVDGRWRPRDVIVERNDVAPPRRDERGHAWRNSAGAALATFDPIAPLAVHGVDVVSLATGHAVDVRADWPLLIEPAGEDRVSVGPAGAWELVPARGSRARVDRDAVVVEQAASPYERRAWWPAVCWRIDGRTGCHELTPRWISAHPEARFPRPARDADVTDGRRLDSTSECAGRRTLYGTWYVAGAVRWPADCEVVFDAGAILLFGPGASLTVDGATRFPERGQVFFRAANAAGWAGVQLRGGTAADPLVVRNAGFDGAIGAAGVDAALTIAGGHAEVVGCAFTNNTSDDALAVRDATVRVTDSMFDANIDAIDLDRSSGAVERNLIHGAIGDSIDLSECRDVTVAGNVVIASGDKAVSVGERSSARVTGNALRDNTVAVAVKDGSRVALDGNVIARNRVGVWLYATADPTARGGGRVAGSSAFADNASDARVGAGELALEALGVAAAGDPEALGAAIVSGCDICARAGRAFGLRVEAGR